jgi:hypothetical protein
MRPPLGHFPIPTELQRALEFLLAWEYLGS